MELQDLEPSIYCAVYFDQFLNYPVIQGDLGESTREFVKSKNIGKSRAVRIEGQDIVCQVNEEKIVINDNSIDTTKNKVKDLDFFKDIVFPIVSFVLKQIKRDLFKCILSHIYNRFYWFTSI